MQLSDFLTQWLLDDVDPRLISPLSVSISLDTQVMRLKKTHQYDQCIDTQTNYPHKYLTVYGDKRGMVIELRGMEETQTYITVLFP